MDTDDISPGKPNKYSYLLSFSIQRAMFTQCPGTPPRPGNPAFTLGTGLVSDEKFFAYYFLLHRWAFSGPQRSNDSKPSQESTSKPSQESTRVDF